MRQPKVLLILQGSSERIGTIGDHIHAIERGINADVFKIDSLIAEKVNFDLFDVIILHYSLVIVSQNYISDNLREKIGKFSGLTILFIQDEYRWIDKTAESLRELDVNVVFSLVSPDTVRKVYHHPWCRDIRFEYTLTGFVPEDLVYRKVPDFEDRVVAVAYRARKLSAWYGHHTLQKWQIAEKFMADAKTYGLIVDISTEEEDRIYGSDWIEFISSAQASLGTESGASVCDFTGEIQANVEKHLEKFPGAAYEELRELYFADADGQIVMNVISPRCFEAAALRSLMILYPGEYGGILEPGRHYVTLQEDHSNIEEVVDILRNSNHSNKIIKTAYDEIASSGNWGYKSLAEHVSLVIEEELKSNIFIESSLQELRDSIFEAKNIIDTNKLIDINKLLTQIEYNLNLNENISDAIGENFLLEKNLIERVGINFDLLKKIRILIKLNTGINSQLPPFIRFSTIVRDILEWILPQSVWRTVRPVFRRIYRFVRGAQS
jgi:hypothetical protein